MEDLLVNLVLMMELSSISHNNNIQKKNLQMRQLKLKDPVISWGIQDTLSPFPRTDQPINLTPDNFQTNPTLQGQIKNFKHKK